MLLVIKVVNSKVIILGLFYGGSYHSVLLLEKDQYGSIQRLRLIGMPPQLAHVV
jgi:hypothetical protein